METITPSEYENGIRVLMIEYLGIRWAREHVLAPYGSLDRVPETDLPSLYSLAQLDALEVANGAETPWWPSVPAT